MSSHTVKNLVIICLIVVIGVKYFSTIQKGHNWGDDFALYIMEAKNILKGDSYGKTEFVFNPSCPEWSSKTPPIYPLLIAPMYKVFGMNLAAIKAENICFFLLSLVVLFFAFRTEFLFKYLFVLIALVGFSPPFFVFLDDINADIAFLFLIYLSLYQINLLLRSCPPNEIKAKYIVICSLLLYLAYGTKGIGVLLIPSLFIQDLLNNRRLSRSTLIISLLFFFLMAIQIKFIYSDAQYFYFFQKINPSLVLFNLKYYAAKMALLWDNGCNKILRNFLFALLSMLALMGYYRKVRRKTTVYEVFFVLYLISVLIWPANNQGLRYLIPIIPLYIVYTLMGLHVIESRIGAKGRYLFIVVLVIIMASYTSNFTIKGHGLKGERVGNKTSLELFRYIIDKTDAHDGFICYKPRALSLYTGRRCSVYPCSSRQKDIFDYMKKVDTDYIVLGRPFYRQQYLRLFVKENKEIIEKVYSNADFEIYKLKGS